MRHRIEVEERIKDYDSRIDKSDYIEHYSTCYDNAMFGRRIEALKFFLHHNFDTDKINNLLNSSQEHIKKLEEDLKNEKEYSEKEYLSEEIDIYKRFVWECQWVLADTELPKRYREEIKDYEKKIRSLKKAIIEKQEIIEEIEGEV